MLLMPAPKSVNSWPICFLPSARPHFGKYTCASSANRSMMLPPLDVTPPLSKALRYSSATDFRCSSVMVWVLTAIPIPPPLGARVPDRQVGIDVDPYRLDVRHPAHRLEPHLPSVSGAADPAERGPGVDPLVAVDPDHPGGDLRRDPV